MEVEKSIEATILDYIRFFPEEVQGDYAAMLQRCNFHDAADPCFPIMLFLLFFQESICEKMEQLDSSIQKNRDEIRQKQINAAPDEAKKHPWPQIMLVLLTVFNLTVCGWLAYRAFAYRVPEIRQTREISEPDPLREMNRYWLAKLAADEHAAAAVPGDGGLKIIVLSIGSSALLSLVFWALVMHRLKRQGGVFPASPKLLTAVNRKQRIIQLFSRIAAPHKSAAEKRNEAGEKTVLHSEK